MAWQYSVAVRNARLAAIEATVGVSPRLQLRSGAPPASCASAPSGTLLAEIQLPADWLADPADGAAAVAGVPHADTAADAAGTVGHFRLVSSDGSVCHAQGTVGTAAQSPDLVMDNPVVALGQRVDLAGLAWTEGGA